MLKEHLKEGVREGGGLWVSLVLGVTVFTILYSVFILIGVSERDSVLWSFPFLAATLILTQVFLRAPRTLDIDRDYQKNYVRLKAMANLMRYVVPSLVSFVLGFFGNFAYSALGVPLWPTVALAGFVVVAVLLTGFGIEARSRKH
ncbi:MAG: hypothetical protein HW403_648 [Dehalococcoidia bacterium]|nr:hypothetical protein [Dehalococcoidia bacterium]